MVAFAGRAQQPVSTIIEKVIVEPFHIATSGDEANGGPKAGSVTWRIYLDLIPDAEFLFITGDKADVNRTLKFSTTTTFFNHANGDVQPNVSKANAIAGTIGFDTYLTAGAATNDNYFGVPKTIDPSGYVLNTGAAFNPSSISPGVDFTPNFKNTPGVTYESTAVTFGPDLGQKGYDPSGQNILLIGQFTTDGEFCFNMSAGVRNKNGDFEFVMYSDDVIADGTEFVLTDLKQCPKIIPNDNKLPVATLTAPLASDKVCKDSTLTIKANATDADGTVKKVEFFANNVSIGADTTSPFEITYKPLTLGPLNLKVVATDNMGAMSKDSSIAHVTVNVTDCGSTNKIPTVTVATLPVDSVCVGKVLEISAIAADLDGTVTQVEFFVNGNSVGADMNPPYAATFTPNAVGPVEVKAVAKDNLGALSIPSTKVVYAKNCTITVISSVTPASILATIYPNPATYGNEIKVEIANVSGKTISVEVTDLLGRNVYSKQVAVTNNTASTSVNASDLSKGTYLAVIRTQENVMTKKLVIE